MSTLQQPVMAFSQVGAVSRPVVKETRGTGLVSIVVPCFGQLEYMRLCVPRILKYSRGPFEVIFVDVATLDGTADYLAGVAGVPGARAEVIEADADIGLVDAWRAGLERAGGEYVVFLSNDTVVGERWLNHLVAAARVEPGIGMVGTMSNVCPPPQWVGRVPYRARRLQSADGRLQIGNSVLLDLEPIDAFAREWRTEYQGKSFEVPRLGGSCLLLKTEVCRKIDWTDMSTPFGAVDGDVLSEKVRGAGYRLVCCKDLFLHHFGSRLFVALRVTEK